MPLSIRILEFPKYKYYPSHLADTWGPQSLARLRLLQACESLDIPRKLWPKIPFPKIPLQKYNHPYYARGALKIPEFEPLYESESEWKVRMQKAVDAFAKKALEQFREQLRDDLKRGILKPVKATRDTTPLDLRYEWAAKRICYRTPFAELASESGKGYTEERVRQAVWKITQEVGLNHVK